MPAAALLSPMNLNGARVCVTGASGFIGRHVLHALHRVGAETVGLINREHFDRQPNLLADDAALRIFDTPFDIARIVTEIEPDYVIHLFAEITTERSTSAIHSTLSNNLLPSIALMEACLSNKKLHRLILMGSGEEFGPVTGSFDDSTIPDPPSPYGASKAATTAYAKMFYQAFGLPVTVLRPTVVYGPFQAHRMLIPQIMNALRTDRSIDVTEGKQTRDFIHVTDVAEGILAALVRAESNGRSYNLGSGEVVTVRDCLSLIEDISGRRGLIRYGALPYKKGEIFSYKPLLTNTHASLNWKANIALRDGLSSTWDWFQLQGKDREAADLQTA